MRRSSVPRPLVSLAALALVAGLAPAASAAGLGLSSAADPARAASAAPQDTASTGTRDGGPLPFAPRGLTTDRFPAATTPVRVDVPAHDGVALHARVYRPDTASDPSWRTPVVLVHSPYYDGVVLGSATRSLDLVERFTPKGYTVVLSDLRGTGNSGGCGEQDGPNQARDFRTLVEHFAAQPWSNGKVAGYGKSYDAESQKAGAVLQPRGLETMVVVAGISSLYDVAYFDGVPLRANGALSAAAYELYDLDVPNQTSALPRRTERGTCQPANFVNGADPSGDRTTYWSDRDFRPGVADVRASVLEVQGLTDFIVSPLQLDGWFDELRTFKRAVVGQWAHWYPYDSPAAYARDDWYDSVHAWLDAELLDLPTGIEEWPAVQVQDEAGVWRGVPSIAGMGTERALPVGSALGTTGGPALSFREDGNVVRETAPLAAPLHLSGQAYLDTVLTLDRPDGHLAVTLSEVTATGTTRTLTRGYLSLPHRESLLRQVPVTPGHPTPYRVRTYPFDKTIAAGSRLRLTVAGFDGSTTPAGTAYTATMASDGSTVLRIPVAQDQCGLAVRTRQAPRGVVPGCPDGVPAEPTWTDPVPGAGRALAALGTPTTETVGGVEAVRQSGYLTVRDGVRLAFEVVRPDDGAEHPVLFTYDGYAAGADPDSGYAARYLPRGYALVGMNLRGTGCSSGTFDFFQPAEARDAYEAIEWMAAQPWSTGRVGMIGKSYPGITQLFAAQQQPPSLAAITPGHYFGDAYRDIAFPGGVFNHGFAALWSFVAQPLPGDAAAARQAPSDQPCLGALERKATNARTNPFLQAQEHRTMDALLRERSPLTRLEDVRVPVFSAFGWQDEQLMSRNTHVVSELFRLGVPSRTVFANGDHGMYRRGPQLAELDRFLEAHVEERPVLRDGTPRARYLAEDPVQVFWEQAGSGQPRFRTSLPSWGDQAEGRRLFLGADGSMAEGRPHGPGSDTYAHTAAGSQSIANPRYATSSLPDQSTWGYAPPPGAALAYTSPAFSATTPLLGPASADLWLTATAPNVDLQVTLTEVRADGQEVYVNQGWLRTSQRALDRSSTELLPVQTHEAVDARPLSPTVPSLARVEVFPFGHVVRPGSRLRLWVEAPTVLPQLEAFALDPTPAAVTVWRDSEHPSSLVLPVAQQVSVPESASAQPACGTVLRQPCRPDARP